MQMIVCRFQLEQDFLQRRLVFKNSLGPTGLLFLDVRDFIYPRSDQCIK